MTPRAERSALPYFVGNDTERFNSAWQRAVARGTPFVRIRRRGRRAEVELDMHPTATPLPPDAMERITQLCAAWRLPGTPHEVRCDLAYVWVAREHAEVVACGLYALAHAAVAEDLVAQRDGTRLAERQYRLDELRIRLPHTGSGTTAVVPITVELPADRLDAIRADARRAGYHDLSEYVRRALGTLGRQLQRRAARAPRRSRVGAVN